MKKNIRWIAILFGMICLLNAAWEHISPEGGIFYAIDMPSHDTVYIGGYGTGLWRTIDGGNSWEQVSVCEERPIWEIYVSRNDPNKIYIAVAKIGGWNYYDSNILRTEDGGNIWIPCAAQNDILSWPFKVNPENEDLIFAAPGTGASAPGYRSTDGGVTWEALPFSDDVSSFGINPHCPNKIFAGTSGAIVYMSTDYGETWQEVFNGGGGWIASFAFHPVDSNIVYMVVGNVMTGYELYKSLTGGLSWNYVGEIPASHNVRTLLVKQDNPDILYAACGVILRSTDGGVNWYNSSSGIVNPQIFLIVNDPLDPNTFYVPNVFGACYKTENAGLYWTQCSSGIKAMFCDGIAFDPNDPNIIYVVGLAHGIFKTTDAGVTWTLYNNGLPLDDLRFSAIAVDPVNPFIIYTSLSPGSEYFAPTAEIYRSFDGGETWEYTTDLTVAGGNTGCCEIIVDSSSNVYAVTHSTFWMFFGDSRICMSSDTGSSFVLTVDSVYGYSDLKYINNNFYYPMNYRDNSCHEFSGVATSIDCINWQPFGPENTACTAVDVYDQNPLVAVAGNAAYKEIQKTHDGGNTWYTIGAFPSADRIVDIEIITPDTILALVSYGGYPAHSYYFYYESTQFDSAKVFITYDGGISGWEEFMDGIDYKIIHRLVARDDTTFYITTRGGIYRYVFTSQNVVEKSDKKSKMSVILPNICKDKLILYFSLLNSSPLEISIYDLAGRVVNKFKKGYYSPGFHKVSFDVSSLRKGVYFVELKMGLFKEVEKIILK